MRILLCKTFANACRHVCTGGSGDIGDCETRPGRGISQGQRDLVKRLSAEYHARVPAYDSLDSGSDGMTPEGVAEESGNGDAAASTRAIAAVELSAAASTATGVGGAGEARSWKGAGFQGAANPFTSPSMPQKNARHEEMERVVRLFFEGKHTAAQDPKGLLSFLLQDKTSVAKGAGGVAAGATRSAGTSKSRGRGGPAKMPRRRLVTWRVCSRGPTRW